MRAVVQRVSQASVSIDNQIVAGFIQTGLLILLGIGDEDTEEKAAYLAKKISNLRIFSDSGGKMNLSILEIKGEAIVVSQFTLFADTRKGNRPSFINAGNPQHANLLVDFFADCLRTTGIPTQQGIFGADMKVSLTNDGPVTILFDV